MAHQTVIIRAKGLCIDLGTARDVSYRQYFDLPLFARQKTVEEMVESLKQAELDCRYFALRKLGVGVAGDCLYPTRWLNDAFLGKKNPPIKAGFLSYSREY